jgi:5-methylthioadenosine/S-adenosylhomocysteine deaminase
MRTLIEHLQFAITVDTDDRIISDAALVVEGSTIADIGTTTEVAGRQDRSSFDEVIDGSMLGVCPGFVDSHVHLSETLSRAVFPDDLDTRTWVFHWAKPFYAHVDPDDEEVGVYLACAEMIRSGTTCLLDMGAQNDTGRTVAAMSKIGIRGITGRHAADNAPTRLPDGWTTEMVAHHFYPSPDVALADLEATVLRWNNSADGRIRCWVNIEGKEPCTLQLHVGARALAQKLGVGTTYHLSTSIEEARLALGKYGKRPVQRVMEAGGLGANLVIAHCVALDDSELAGLVEHNVKIAFCPGTSLKLAKGAAAFGRYTEFMDAGGIVCLGTDGVSASGNLNLMRQMYIAAGLFKDARNDASLIGARKALRMATIDGAKALGWDDEIGSLELGKKADFVLFDLNHVEWTPYHDALQALVWSASPASITETWVDGRPIYRRGKIGTIDEVAIFAEARKRARLIVERAGLNTGGVAKSTSLYS